MRDRNRIKLMLETLQSIWELYPDMRFNQLIDMLQRDYKNGEYIRAVDTSEGFLVNYPDLFYVEDANFYDFLFHYFHENKSK